MDGILAVIGDIGLQHKAQSFVTSCFRDTVPAIASLHERIVPSRSHFVYFARYSTSRAGDYGVGNPGRAAGAASPVIAMARIDNSAELAHGLSPRHEPAESSPATAISNSYPPATETLILQLYKQHGVRHCERLRGTFCYVIWDEELGQAHAVLDPFNARPLFHMQLDGLLYIASDARLLASHPQVSITANKRALAQWLKGCPDPFDSMFNEIAMLPGGCRLALLPGGKLEVARFWDINPDLEIRYGNPQDYAEHFYALLYDSVKARMQTDKAILCSQMSGGMDSTSITALANQIAAGEGLQLHTISHCYKNTRSCDELDKIHLMLEHLQLVNAHYIELDAFDEISFSNLYPTDFDSPGIVLSPKYHQELAIIEALGADALLTGNGGDETCWGHSASYRTRLLQGEIGVIAEVIKACSDLNEPVARSLYKLFVSPLLPDVPASLHKFAGTVPKSTAYDPPWLTAAAADLAGPGHEHANPYSNTFQPGKHARYWSIKTTSTHNSMRSYQKVANHHGVDIRHPFFDQSIVEFSFAVPEKLLIQGVYPKWLLRKSMQGLLPEAVCWNKHKVIFDQHFANLLRSNAQEIRRLLSHTGLQDMGLLDNGKLLKRFDEVMDGAGRHLNVDMLYAILTQSWFQQHCLD